MERAICSEEELRALLKSYNISDSNITTGDGLLNLFKHFLEDLLITSEKFQRATGIKGIKQRVQKAYDAICSQTTVLGVEGWGHSELVYLVQEQTYNNNSMVLMFLLEDNININNSSSSTPTYLIHPPKPLCCGDLLESIAAKDTLWSSYKSNHFFSQFPNRENLRNGLEDALNSCGVELLRLVRE